MGGSAKTISAWPVAHIEMCSLMSLLKKCPFLTLGLLIGMLFRDASILLLGFVGWGLDEERQRLNV